MRIAMLPTGAEAPRRGSFVTVDHRDVMRPAQTGDLVSQRYVVMDEVEVKEPPRNEPKAGRYFILKQWVVG